MPSKYNVVSLSGLVDNTAFSILENDRGRLRLVITRPYKSKKVRLFDSVAEALAFFAAEIGEG
jgi:hypothetical protein